MDQPAWVSNLQELQTEIRSWIHQSIQHQQKIPWQGIHDEGAFISSWYGYYLATGDAKVLDFFHWMRDGYLDWAQQGLHHGCYREGEVHHGTENLILFLARLWPLEKDTAVIDALEDVAHHVGNWIEEIPAWYDWDAHLFRSWFLGSEVVRAMPPHNFNVPDHFRLIQIALSAYLATDESRYLEICQDYTDAWCEAILQEPQYIPAVRWPVSDQDTIERRYGTANANSSHLLQVERGPQSARIELHASAGTVDVLLDLHKLTGGENYLQAAQKILKEMIPALIDPLAETPASLFSKYRTVTGDDQFDGQLLARMRYLEPPSDAISTILLLDSRKQAHPLGIGRRFDEVRWGYRQRSGQIRECAEPSPSALMLGYQISGDDEWLNRALRNATQRLKLTRRSLKDGREHGDAGSTISAVASGHGRAASAGSIVGTYHPAVLGAYRYANADQAKVRYRHGGKLGLPDGVVAVVRPSSQEERHIRCWNDTDDAVSLTIEVDDTDLSVAGATISGESVEVKMPTSVDVTLPAQQETSVQIQLAVSN